MHTIGMDYRILDNKLFNIPMIKCNIASRLTCAKQGNYMPQLSIFFSDKYNDFRSIEMSFQLEAKALLLVSLCWQKSYDLYIIGTWYMYLGLHCNTGFFIVLYLRHYASHSACACIVFGFPIGLVDSMLNFKCRGRGFYTYHKLLVLVIV